MFRPDAVDQAKLQHQIEEAALDSIVPVIKYGPSAHVAIFWASLICVLAEYGAISLAHRIYMAVTR